MVNIFEFQNYREYLRAYYNEQKMTKKSFSYRSFSKKANINTSSFLFHVIQGKKNLTKNTIVKISAAIGHIREESEYFENLVFFNQSDTISEKTYYYSRLIEVRHPIDIENVNKDRYEYYSKWYHSVVREVVTFLDFKGNFLLLGKFLVPPISEREAKDSVNLLEKLGFIERDELGLYHQTSNLIVTRPNPTETFIVQKFQLEMLNVAMKAYDNIALQQRMSTSTTFSISDKTFELIKLRAREFQREVMEMARIDNEQNRAYQIPSTCFRSAGVQTMKMFEKTRILCACIAGLLLLRCGIHPVEITGGASGTELSACVVTGNVVDPEGIPVNGAIVRLRPSSFLSTGPLTDVRISQSKKTIADTLTDKTGGFRFELIDTGAFTIEVNYRDSLGTIMTCEILPVDTGKKIPLDTLFPLSTMSGHIDAFDSNNVPDSTAKIQVYGLQRYVKPDSNGNFTLIVPRGNLSLRFSMDTGYQNEMNVTINVLPDERRDIGSFHLGHFQMPPLQCQNSKCDSIMVRVILDSLKLFSVPVDSVATARDGRIVEVNLQGRNISRVPFGLERLEFLEVLDLSNNSLSFLPGSLGMMHALKKLTLNNNQLTGLFQIIGDLRQLQSLDVSGNELTTLPDSIVFLSALQFLDLNNNRLCGLSPAIAAWATTFDPGWDALQQCP